MTTGARSFAHRAGVAGALLGLVAGIVQALFGSRIPEWTGSKDNPVGLGVLTVVLSALAWTAARQLAPGKALPPNRRLLAAVGLLVPGALCFSTVGRLWYLPGLLLLGAAVMTVGVDTRELVRAARKHLVGGLVGVLGGLEILMAISARPMWLATIGVIAGLALVLAPWPKAGRSRVVLLVLGAVVFPALTWWSVATPLLAVVALCVGAVAVRNRPAVQTEAATPIH